MRGGEDLGGPRPRSGPGVCHTRLMKRRRPSARVEREPAVRAAGPRIATPLFSGTVHFLTVQFRTPAGVVGVSVDDTLVAVAFCRTIAPVASRYASQYGPNSLAIAAGAPNAPVTPSGGTTYSDAELAAWVDSFAATEDLPAGDAVGVLNPSSGVENTDARVSEGVLGYHSISPKGRPYLFVNARGSGFQPADPSGYFALALSHELQELLVDPRADGSNPEVCDPCAGNCGATAALELFDASARYLGSVTTATTAPPPGTKYAFYLNSMVRPANAADCPAPPTACAYPPP